MTPVEHYAEAERLLVQAETQSGATRDATVAKANVHAKLCAMRTTDQYIRPLPPPVDGPSETAAIQALVARGWSLNGVGQTITSLTPRSPVPLPASP